VVALTMARAPMSSAVPSGGTLNSGPPFQTIQQLSKMSIGNADCWKSAAHYFVPNMISGLFAGISQIKAKDL
jgi:hypothetical protein